MEFRVKHSPAKSFDGWLQIERDGLVVASQWRRPPKIEMKVEKQNWWRRTGFARTHQTKGLRMKGIPKHFSLDECKWLSKMCVVSSMAREEICRIHCIWHVYAQRRCCSRRRWRRACVQFQWNEYSRAMTITRYAFTTKFASLNWRTANNANR